MTALLRRISDQITDQISDQAPKLRRISDRISEQAAAGLSAASRTARESAANLYGTVREYPRASAGIVVGAALAATAVWLLVRYPPRFLLRRTAGERRRTTSHTVRRRGRRVRAGRAAAG
jgi:hypothetical protein